MPCHLCALIICLTIKHLFHSVLASKGKYVCPTPIEQAIGFSRFISQVVVCGANRPYNVALVVPDWVAVRSELGISEFDASEEDLVNDFRVKGLISAEIKLNCYSIKKFEVPK